MNSSDSDSRNRISRLACSVLTATAVVILVAGPVTAADFSGPVVSVHDGDTLTVLVDRKQRRVRIADIDAPEAKQAFGTRSRQALAALCHQKPAQVVDRGPDRYGRTIGVVSCAGRDVATEQVRTGMAWVFVRYAPKDSPLYQLEAEAKAAHRGLWADPNPVSPWDWRRQDRARQNVASICWNSYL